MSTVMSNHREEFLVDKAYISALKSKKHQESLTLLRKITNVNTREERTGRHYLHFAVISGSKENVVELLEKSADVNCCDENGDTPLHLAALGGHETIAAILVAFGANLEKENKKGNTPLFVAVKEKSPRMVDILLKFGRSPKLMEWDWSVKKKFSKDEDLIIEFFARQFTYTSGFENGLVNSTVFYVRPKEKCVSDSLNLEVVTDDVTTPFVFQCYKMQLEYGNVRHQLIKDEDVFSDLYECKTWNCLEHELQLDLTVDNCIGKGRTLKFKSIEKSVGRIKEQCKSNADGNAEKTDVTVFLTTRNCEYVKFMITSVEKKEKIKISKQAVTLKPEILPGTEIQIPEDTFNKESNLSLKMVDTEETNKEEGKNLILTDALALTSADGLQPQKDVSMKLPIHTVTDTNNILILASKDDHPDSAEDWEIVEPEHGSNTGSVSFKTNHFSLFVGIAKEIIRNNTNGIKDIHDALERTIAKKKKVIFLVLTKKDDEKEEYSVVVQCCLFRQKNNLEQTWKEKGYNVVNSSESLVCTVNTVFQIALSGNLEESFGKEKLELEFQLRLENFRVFNVRIIDKDKEPKGNINVQKEERKTRVEVVVAEDASCFVCTPNKRSHKEVEDSELKTMFECDLLFVKEAPPEAQPVEDVAKRMLAVRKAFDGFRVSVKRRQNALKED